MKIDRVSSTQVRDPKSILDAKPQFVRVGDGVEARLHRVPWHSSLSTLHDWTVFLSKKDLRKLLHTILECPSIKKGI